jgi:hypothetical protein
VRGTPSVVPQPELGASARTVAACTHPIVRSAEPVEEPARCAGAPGTTIALTAVALLLASFAAT